MAAKWLVQLSNGRTSYSDTSKTELMAILDCFMLEKKIFFWQSRLAKF